VVIDLRYVLGQFRTRDAVEDGFAHRAIRRAVVEQDGTGLPQYHGGRIKITDRAEPILCPAAFASANMLATTMSIRLCKIYRGKSSVATPLARRAKVGS
jgi:hypothetical protein